jgi:chaperonin GroEL
MVKTYILTDEEPLDAILAGAKKLFQAVSTTMGPRGSNVIIRKAGGRSFVTHDGVTVAKSVKLDDPAEDVAADLLREAAMKLDTTTGDGTTTVTVLAYNLLAELADLVRAGDNPMAVKRELDKLLPQVVEAIKKASIKVKTEKQLVQVATISSGSEEIGKAVGQAVYRAGKDTPIILGFSDTTETLTETIKGVRIESGSASAYLLDQGIKSIIENPKVIVCDAKLRDKNDVLPIMKVIESSFGPGERNFVLITSDVAADALSMLVMNRLKGFANIGVVRVPQHIQNHTDYLADIAISTGATVMSRNTGASIMTPEVEYFGEADSAVVKLAETLIINGDASVEDLDARRAVLRETAKKAPEKEVRGYAESRLKFLGQEVISIHVGGQSDTEAEEKHYRYEDALGAAQSALRHGVVPGGGTLLYTIARSLPDTQVGQAFGNALCSPMETVLYNAGIEASAELGRIDIGFGYDVMHPEEGPVLLDQRGVIDPTESELESVKTAVTIAGLLLTSGAMIVDEVIKEPRNEAEQQFNQG